MDCHCDIEFCMHSCQSIWDKVSLSGRYRSYDLSLHNSSILISTFPTCVFVIVPIFHSTETISFYVRYGRMTVIVEGASIINQSLTEDETLPGSVRQRLCVALGSFMTLTSVHHMPDYRAHLPPTVRCASTPKVFSRDDRLWRSPAVSM
jgi:hypothetical protein